MQRILSIALGRDIPPTGVFSDSTTQDIIDFQALAGLPENGFMNCDSWPTLLDTVTPLSAGATGVPVEALQDGLQWSGYEVAMTGVFDEQTKVALARFQADRGATATGGDIVDAQTWHLITTQCNSTLESHYWFDFGWPQGNGTQETLRCLLDAGFEFGVFECWREQGEGTFWPECVASIANAWAVGYAAVDVYMYPNRNYDPTSQAEQLMGNLTLNQVRFGAVMLDVEGDDWYGFSQEQNRQFMLDLKAAFASFEQPLRVYSGRAWDDYFGANFTDFSMYPLIYAHYDNVPSTYDWDFSPYGGWTKASGKQFWDGVSPEVSCGLSIDWDWSPVPFWFQR